MNKVTYTGNDLATNERGQTFTVLTPHNWIEGQTYEEGRDYKVVRRDWYPETKLIMEAYRDFVKDFPFKPILQPIVKERTIGADKQPEDVDKDTLVKQGVFEAGKLLMSLFYACDLKTHIETMMINDVDGQEFILTFKTVDKWKVDQQEQKQTVEASTPEPSPSLASHSCTDGNTDGQEIPEDLKDFMDEVMRMQSLYNNNRYGLAEALRDKLSERLDDIMRQPINK